MNFVDFVYFLIAEADHLRTLDAIMNNWLTKIANERRKMSFDFMLKIGW